MAKLDNLATSQSLDPVREGIRIPGLQLLSEIGRGTSSVVYLAQKVGGSSNGIKCAVKILKSKDEASSLLNFKRIRKEACALARINHPLLVKNMETGRTSGFPYLVMEYFEGHNLALSLQGKPLPENEIIKLALQVANVLIEVHKHGLVHCDIKPQNILINSIGEIKLIDFGLAAQPESERFDEVVVGTLLYSPPEQNGMLNRPIDGRSDLYSLGVVLFQASTGQVPFFSTQIGELVHQHSVVKPPSVRELNPLISEGLSQIIAKLLAKDPDDRYQSSYSLSIDLENFCSVDQSLKVETNLGSTDAYFQQHLQTRIIGRSSELSQLNTKWLETSKGKGGLVLVSGHAGVGKSRLVHELAEQARTSHAEVFSGRLSLVHSAPLAPFKNALDDFLTRIARLAPLERTQSETNIVRAAGEYAPLLKRFTPKIAALFKDIPDLVDTPQAREQFFDAVAELFLNLALPEKPLVLIIDDIQWLDDSSLGVLKRILRKADQKAILVLCTARNDAKNTDSLNHFLTAFNQRMLLHLEVNDLDFSATQELISNYLGSVPIDVTLTQQVYLRAQGNPFALKQFLNALLNEGLLHPSWGTWALDIEGLSKLALPSNVALLIARRIESLSQPSRLILGKAAVLGSRFDLGLLPEICGTVIAKVNQAIQEGVSASLIELTPRGDYVFIHDQAYEVLLAQFSPEELKHLHRKTAQTIDLLPTESQDLIFSLAYHYNLGEPEKDSKRVYEINFIAGKRSIQQYVDDEAYQYFKQAEVALAATNPSIQSLEFEQIFGDLCIRLGKLDEGIHHLEGALEHSIVPLKRSKIFGKLMAAWLYNGDSAKSWQYAERAFIELKMFPPKSSKSNIVLAFLFGFTMRLWSKLNFVNKKYLEVEEIEKSKILVSITNSASLFGFFQGKVGIATNLALRTMYCSKSLVSSPELIYTYVFQALLLSVLGLRTLAKTRIQRAITLSQHIKNPIALSRSMFFKVNCLFILGEDREATALCDEVVRDYGKWVIGDDYVMYTVFHHMTLLLRGKSLDLLELNHRVSDFFDQKSSQIYLESSGYLISFRMAALAFLGRTSDAVEYFKKREEYFRDKSDYFSQFVVDLTCQAFFYLEQEEYGEPTDTLISQHENLGPHGSWDMIDVCSFYVPKAHLRLGQWIRASKADKENRLLQLKNSLNNLRRVSQTSLMKTHRLLVTAIYERLCGNLSRAEKLLASVDRSSLEIDSPWLSFEVLKNRAAIFEARGNLEASAALGRMALNIAIDQGWEKRALSIKSTFDLDHQSTSKNINLNSFQSTSKRNSSNSLLTRESINFRRNLDALMQLTLASANVIDPEELAQIALRETVRLLGGERALLFLCHEKTGELKFQAGRDFNDHKILEPEDYCRSVVSYVRVKQEPLVYTGSEHQDFTTINDSIASHNLRSIIAAPLFLKERFMGILYLDGRSARGIFSVGDLEILRALGCHIVISIETARTAQLELEKKAFAKDMELTRAVQTLLLPKINNFASHSLRMSALFQPASQVGGDWWWFDEHKEGVFRILVGDVTGHGAASAMVTAMVASSYQTIQTQLRNASLPEILKALDQVLIQLCSGNYWMTMSALEINTQSHSVKWWSACAPPIFVCRKTGTIEMLESDDLNPHSPLGTDHFLLNEKVFDLQSGDKLLVFTDGLFEFKQENGEEYGLRRLKKLFASVGVGASAEALRNLVQVKSNELIENEGLDDDITCVALEMLS